MTMNEQQLTYNPEEDPLDDPVEEARRYVKNAQTTLVEHGKLDLETNCYGDPNEVKTKQRPHPDIRDYRVEIAKFDRKLLTMVNAAYETAHITMGYDGNLSKTVCAGGIQLANAIIDRCASMPTKFVRLYPR